MNAMPLSARTQQRPAGSTAPNAAPAPGSSSVSSSRAGDAAGPRGVPGSAPPTPSDAVLIDRLRDGDAAAGEVLVSRYAPALLRYLQRLAGSDHLAEELHQQT